MTTEQSYSQFGEDRVLADLFPKDYVGSYIDIGSADPILMSNTYLLYQQGWRGICIDPVPKHIAAHEERRPDDIALRLAIGDADLEVLFYENQDCPSVSTTVPTEAAKMMQETINISAYEVQMKTMASLIDQMHLNPAPDLLSIDVEGNERAVLEGIPFEQGWLPSVIIIEACYPRTRIPSHEEWEHILTSAGYVLYRTVGVNNIYLLGDPKAATWDPSAVLLK
jgi:FkbM family methyltransferase